MIDFKKLPIQIQKRMLDVQVEQGNPYNSNIFVNDITSDRLAGGFNWLETVEGISFWGDVIINDNHATFFEKYPFGIYVPNID